jgi:hypothetical protein
MIMIPDNICYRSLQFGVTAAPADGTLMQSGALCWACHYESKTALKGVERRWEALAPAATQRL